MKTVATVLALACLAHCAVGTVSPRQCVGAPAMGCSAVSILQIVVTRGSCRGTSSADCKAWSQSQSAFKDAFAEWWSAGDKICDGNTVQATAKAVATAIAKVWTSAAVNVECDDDAQGFACGWAFANGRSLGRAVAEAIATAAADASLALSEDGSEGADTADAFCFAEIRAMGAAFAEAASTAQVDACTSTGQDPVSVYEESFVTAIQTVVAESLARASARACKSGGDFVAESKCEGVGEQKSDGSFSGAGDFCFGLADVPACEGPGAEICCARTNRVCPIRRSICAGCKAPWRRVRSPDSRVFWENMDGEQCFCKDA